LRTGALQPSRAAFTLVEVMFAMVIIGFLVVSLYAAIATSASWVRACQENEAVTQILSERLDTIRLYNWDQVTNRSFVQTNFVVGIDPIRTNSRAYYTGRVDIVHPAPIAESAYRTNIVQVTVTVNWISGSRPQTRTMTSFVTQYGIQSFVAPNP
jgi:prepilin-type N-terminal cleavage/methylation domain-containing protein